MTRKRAKSMDQTSFWALGSAEAPEKLYRLPMASPEPGRMLELARLQGFIWRMSAQWALEAAETAVHALQRALAASPT
jgi:hypothetical protein